MIGSVLSPASSHCSAASAVSVATCSSEAVPAAAVDSEIQTQLIAIRLLGVYEIIINIDAIWRRSMNPHATNKNLQSHMILLFIDDLPLHVNLHYHFQGHYPLPHPSSMIRHNRVLTPPVTPIQSPHLPISDRGNSYSRLMLFTHCLKGILMVYQMRQGHCHYLLLIAMCAELPGRITNM